MKYNILNTIGKAFDPAAQEILNKLGKVEYTIPTQTNLDETIGKYEIVVIGLGLTFFENTLEKATKLKYIVTATTGLDHIDLKAAEKRGIKVLSLKGENDFLNTITGTAELALGLMISLARHIPTSNESVLRGEWDRESFKGHSLFGYTLGVVGLGRLGTWMARYGESLGMKVLYTDPNINATNPAWKKVSFEEIIKNSDVISIHVHLSPETEYMFHKKTFTEMKKSAYLVNTSRGKIVHEQDLIEALDEKKIAGYATDVLDGETLFTGNNCSEHLLVMYSQKNKNVIVVPHIGGMTYESRRDTDIFIAKKLVNSLK